MSKVVRYLKYISIIEFTLIRIMYALSLVLDAERKTM
jgi:hypothetical protein